MLAGLVALRAEPEHVERCPGERVALGQHLLAAFRDAVDVDDPAAPFALEVAMRPGFAVVAQEPFAEVEREREAVCGKKFQRVVDGRPREPGIVGQQRLVDGIYGGVRVDAP